MIQFKFKTIDDWNRPIFKSVKGNIIIGSTDILVPNKKLFPNNSKEEVIEYFKNNKDKLCYFGIKVNCEPMGTEINPDKFEIID